MIFQDAANSLNPVFQVGRQLNDIIRCHFPVGNKEATQRTLSLLEQVKLPDPQRIFRCYPHELSGGMAQRVMIAMALSCEPELIIADEPTTALDVKTQLQIMHLIKSFQQIYKFGLLLITHDLQLISDMVEDIYVFLQGRVIEKGSIKDLRKDSQHTYTDNLFQTGLQWSKAKYPVSAEKK